MQQIVMGTNTKYLDVIKASAGSGKTHRLTNEYIDLLLSGEKEAYKHILAVTFTNKATDEMKSRVIETLYAESLKNTDKGHQAGKVLTEILHDYTSFSISTIDRFFQTAMRAFAREIGQYASYKVELDSSGVLNLAIDTMMSSLDDADNTQLLKWLLVYSLDMIEKGKSWNIVGELQNFGTLFLKEDFKLKRRGMPSVFGDKNFIAEYRKKMNGIITRFEERVRAIGVRATDLISENGLVCSDFKGGSKSPFFYFETWKNGEPKVPTATFVDLYDNIERWSTKTASESVKSGIESVYHAGLNECVLEAIFLFDKSYEEYRSALIIRDNIYIIGIFSDIYKYMTEYLKDNNVVLLSETADVLNRIIDGNDTPFIYEKIGTRFDHIMLDEFQDTSTLQWDNFKPLLSDSMASGNRNLIVGDIKQSIYRWRGSDWKLLDEDIFKSFRTENINTLTLEDNWRSCENIVQFNNDFFKHIGGMLAGADTDIAEKVSRIYADCEQKTPDKLIGRKGHVKISFVEKDKADVGVNEEDTIGLDKWKSEVLSLIDSDLKALLSAGYTCRDIAVLTRTNSEGSAVASKLISLGYEVITEDSLLLGSSECVGIIVSQLKYAIDPDNVINNLINSKYHAEKQIKKAEIESMALYDICEEIIRDTIDTVPEYEIPFVNAFMDSVVSYTDRYGSDLKGFIKWWDDSGHRTSISAPQGQDAIRIMTIHKAKGLGFEVVILPFMCDKFKPGGTLQPYIWCKPDRAPFSEIGLIPLKASSSLENTIFKNDYREEILLSHIDNINNAYVAFTRAKSELIVYAAQPVADKKGNLPSASVSDVLYHFLKDKLVENSDGDSSGCCAVYEVGSIHKIADEGESGGINEQLQDKFVSIPIGERLKLSLRGTDFFDTSAHGEIVRDESFSSDAAGVTGVRGERLRGIVLHDILSRINTVDDLAGAVRDAVSQGELSAEYEESTCLYLRQLLDKVADRHWFDGTYRAINEISIINTDGSVSRPDRVLIEQTPDDSHGGGLSCSDIHSSRVIVIDYKFGEPNPAHKRQIDGYVRLIQQMGYTNVVGEVWYTTK
ncbi:MAG: UvrD-helicase domain-containing protein [Bacteroidales bacterium]|nr:UvrD-helicase domain-containing protein [Bacteroidales bacterium]MDD4670122.1 UvrD-helicase domain-containing protein [Bacteroidales bacterium]